LPFDKCPDPFHAARTLFLRFRFADASRLSADFTTGLGSNDQYPMINERG
jgi:hypothetical protein